MPLKFSIRDLLLVTVIAAVGTSWWLDHRRLSAEPERSVAFGLTPNGTPVPTLGLEWKQLAPAPSVTKVQTKFRTPLGAGGENADFYPHGLMEGRQRVTFKGDQKTFAWQEAVGQRVTVEGLAWGSMEKGLGEYVIMNDAEVFVDRGDFLKLKVYGRAVSVSGILHQETGIAGSPLQVFIIKDAAVRPLDKVEWPWMTRERGNARAPSAQTTSANQKEPKSVIEVGGSILAAEDILRKSQIDFHEGGLALTNVNADTGFLTCFIDEQRMTAALFYSKSTKKITSIDVIFFPQLRHTKLEEIWADAKSLTLGEHGGYSIQFLPARPPREQSQANDEFPRSGPALDPDSGAHRKENQATSQRIVAPHHHGKEPSPFEGEWEVCSANYGLSDLVYYTFRGNRLTVETWRSTSIEKRADVPRTKDVTEWTFEIDEAQTPSRLVMKSVEPPGKDPVVNTKAYTFKDGKLWLAEDNGKQITFDPGKFNGRLTGFARRHTLPRREQ